MSSETESVIKAKELLATLRKLCNEKNKQLLDELDVAEKDIEGNLGNLQALQAIEVNLRAVHENIVMKLRQVSKKIE